MSSFQRLYHEWIIEVFLRHALKLFLVFVLDPVNIYDVAETNEIVLLMVIRMLRIMLNDYLLSLQVDVIKSFGVLFELDHFNFLLLFPQVALNHKVFER